MNDGLVYAESFDLGVMMKTKFRSVLSGGDNNEPQKKSKVPETKEPKKTTEPTSGAGKRSMNDVLKSRGDEHPSKKSRSTQKATKDEKKKKNETNQGKITEHMGSVLGGKASSQKEPENVKKGDMRDKEYTGPVFQPDTGTMYYKMEGNKVRPLPGFKFLHPVLQRIVHFRDEDGLFEELDEQGTRTGETIPLSVDFEKSAYKEKLAETADGN
jgi:hypothetical protein